MFRESEREKGMKGWWCKERMCLWLKKSSSARLLGFMFPVVVVVGVVVLGVIAYGDVKGSRWMFASNVHSWIWPPVAPSNPFSGDGTTLSSNVREDTMTSLSPPEVTADFRPKLSSSSAVVGGGGSGEEAPSVHFVINQSASPPPLAVDHIQTEKPVSSRLWSLFSYGYMCFHYLCRSFSSTSSFHSVLKIFQAIAN
jgi:hypothetical protein